MKKFCLNCCHADIPVVKVHNTRGIALGLLFLSLFLPVGVMGAMENWRMKSDDFIMFLVYILSAALFVTSIVLLIIRTAMKKEVCHLCGNANLIPANSPMAQQHAKQ